MKFGFLSRIWDGFWYGNKRRFGVWGAIVVGRALGNSPRRAAVGGDRLSIMQNSSAAMELRGQVMPPELKQLEESSASPVSTTITIWSSWPLYLSDWRQQRRGGHHRYRAGPFPSTTWWRTFASRRCAPACAHQSRLSAGQHGHERGFLTIDDGLWRIFGGQAGARCARTGLAPSLLTNNGVIGFDAHRGQ